MFEENLDVLSVSEIKLRGRDVWEGVNVKVG